MRRKSARSAFVAIAKECNDTALFVQNANEWYVDSGSSKNMTPNKSILSDYQNANNQGNVIISGKESLTPGGTGNVYAKIEGKEIDMKNVLHVPGLQANLLSVSKMVKNGNKIVFDDSGCTILDKNTNKKIVHCIKENGVYKTNSANGAFLSTKQKGETAIMWPRKLGHLNYQTMKKMQKAVCGIKFSDDDTEILNCIVCSEAKQSREPLEATQNQSIFWS